MITMRVASAFFSVGSMFCGLYAGYEAFEQATQHAFEQQDGYVTPIERATDETPYIYLLSGIGGACIAGSIVAAAGVATDEWAMQKSANQAG